MRLPKARITVPAAIVALLLLLVLAAPTAARYGLVRILSDRLQVPVSIEDVDLDLLDGEARIINLRIAGNSGSDLTGSNLYADIDLGALVRGDIVVQAARLEGLRLKILRAESGQLVIVIPLATDEAQAEEASAELPLFELEELVIIDTEVDIDLPPLQGRLRVADFRLTTLTTMTSEPARLELAADWNGAAIAVNGSLSPFEETPWFDGELSLQRADLREAQRYLPPPLAGLGGMLDMRWRGRASTESLALDGNLALESVRADLDNLQVTADALSWQGTLNAAWSGDAPGIAVAGDMSGSGLGIGDEVRGLTLFQLAGVQAEELTVAIDQTRALAVARLALQDVRAVDTGDPEQQLLQGKAIEVRALDLRDNTLLVGSISSEELVSNLYFTAEDGLVARGVLTTSFETLAEQRAGEAESEPLQWRIQETAMRNGRMTVIDRQFEHPFRLEMAVEELSLGALDSSRPDDPASVSLKAGVGEYGRILVNGQISALAPGSKTELEGHIKSLALPTLSPYSEYLLGYELIAGQYDHDFDLKILDSHITASNELALRKTRVKKLKDAKPVAPLPMPLDVALDMLRDRKDNIELSVPLDGQLDDPEFGLDQAISRALAKGLQAGSTAYLKFILQPYGAIWTGAELGLKMIGKVQLDPMPFPPGSAELGAEQLDYAGKLATMLAERPSIELHACGEAGRADHLDLLDTGDQVADEPAPDMSVTPEQQRQLLQLAEERSDALKRWLVNEKGIAPERIYPCKPSANPAGKINGIRLEV